jgi:hypothetical protein
VDIAFPEQATEPTALAIIAINATGVPQYWFHVDGTATFRWIRP